MSSSSNNELIAQIDSLNLEISQLKLEIENNKSIQIMVEESKNKVTLIDVKNIKNSTIENNNSIKLIEEKSYQILIKNISEAL